VRNPFVVAEFAGSHDGDLDKMLRGVHAAKQADADAFKTWWTSSAERTCARMNAPDMLETYRLGEFPMGWLYEIRKACTAHGLEFICTVDLPEDIPVIAPYVDRFKVASWGAKDKAFIEAHAKHGKPLIISTGLDGGQYVGVHAAFLHCVSAYPTPLEDVNLAVLWDRDQYEDTAAYQGFSDHTKKVMMGALAVAAGARILEVHFCLPETSKDNADRCVSHEPDALREYIALARKAAIAMGDGVKRVMPSEEKFVRFRYA
jgi:sialic acid synthase SpsE